MYYRLLTESKTHEGAGGGGYIFVATKFVSYFFLYLARYTRTYTRTKIVEFVPPQFPNCQEVLRTPYSHQRSQCAISVEYLAEPYAYCQLYTGDTRTILLLLVVEIICGDFSTLIDIDADLRLNFHASTYSYSYKLIRIKRCLVSGSALKKYYNYIWRVTVRRWRLEGGGTEKWTGTLLLVYLYTYCIYIFAIFRVTKYEYLFIEMIK